MLRSSYKIIQEKIKSQQTAEETSEVVKTVQYVYHRKPPEFIGNWIVPLNKMPDLPDFETNYKQTYENAKIKYTGRESTMSMKWPALDDCKWNDVNFLSPLHPNYIYDEFNKIGISTADEKTSYFFRIPVSNLNPDPRKTIIWTFQQVSDDPAVLFSPDSFCPIDEEYEELDGLPEKTRQYYRDELNKGKIPLTFYYIPHVVTTKPIEVTADIEVVHWRNRRQK